MPDTSAPNITRITLPATVDLSGGAQAATIAVEVDDGVGGSGVREVTLQFDHELVRVGEYVQGYGYVTVGGIGGKGPDTFRDATPNSANEVLLLDQRTSAGTYNLLSISVYDNAGNSHYYDAQALAALGLTPSMTVVGSKVDREGASLVGFQLPDVDLSKGDAQVPLTVTARDNDGGNGVHHVYFTFDKNLETRFGQSNAMLLGGQGFNNGDDFGDGTPEQATDNVFIGKNTPAGTYNVVSLRVVDASGNATMYYQGQLQQMGLRTSFEVKGSTLDTTAPVLTGLQLPSVINLSSGNLSASFAAMASDGVGGSGVDLVSIWLDGQFSMDGYTSPLLVVGRDGFNSDTFKDSTPEYGRVTHTIGANSNPGIYDITSVEVSDKAGNKHVYSNAELKLMNINTRFELTNGQPHPAATAWVVPTRVDNQVTLALHSNEVSAAPANIEFDLTYQYMQGDPRMATIGNESKYGLGNGDGGGYGTMRQHFTGSATLSHAGDTLALVNFQLNNGVGDMAYLISNLTVNGKALSLPNGGDAWFQWGTDGADILYGAVGNDYLDGGAGRDVVRYSRDKAGYVVMKGDDGFVVMGPSGNEHLRNIERIEFKDRAIVLELDGNAAKAYRVYQAAFDRKPDAAGLGYWIAQMDKGVSLEQVSAGFIDSTEFQNRYGSNSSDATFVNGLYRNVLHRTGESAGVKFWLDALQHGVSRAEVLSAFSEGAENQAQVIGSIQNGIEFAPWLS